MTGLRNLSGNFAERHAWKIRRFVFWAAIIVVGAVAVVAAAFYFDEFTEGHWFCGKLCHANRPQGITLEVSSHANVECGTCHIGPGLWPKVEAKILSISELVSTIANSFERPIELPVERMKPADVVCEQCHWAEKEYPESVHLTSRFASDEQNTESQTVYSVYVSEANQAGKPGAHWHIENTVLYASADEVQQEIPWVAVESEDGTLVEYVTTASSLSEDELESLHREEMDCLTCHNRAAHQFRNPEGELDKALAAGEVSPDLPYVKREGMALLSGDYASQDEGIEQMAGLAEFYASEYPATLAGMEHEIDTAVEVLQEIYHTTVFPEMNLTWDVYPDNLGHSDSPGCFRCHDGKHVSTTGGSISRDCTSCHSLPTAPADQRQQAPTAEEPTAASVVVPTISHTLEGRGQCLMCHGSGPLGVPESHAGLTDEGCTSCHLPGDS
jgi:hypothetical protein